MGLLRPINSLRRRTATWRMRHLSRHKGLDPSTLERRSDTAFVLGSGPSVNELSDAAWAEIARYDSFGFNFWLLHSHLPRFYLCEGFRNSTDREFFKARLAERAEDYRNVTWLLQAPEILKYLGSMAAFFDLFPGPEDPALVWLKYRRALLRKEGEFTRMFFEPQARTLGDRHLKGFGTPTLALSIAAAMGYQRIVLVGVDLDRPGYFWQSGDGPHQDFRRSDAEAHKTSSHQKYHPVQDHLLAFHRLVLEPEGRALMLATDTGLLAGKLPTYEFGAGVQTP